MAGALTDPNLHSATCVILRAMVLNEPVIPEHHLLVDMTDRAVRDLAKKHGKEFRSAVSWFSSNSHEPLAFEVMCDFFGLNPFSVRNTLTNMGLLT